MSQNNATAQAQADARRYMLGNIGLGLIALVAFIVLIFMALITPSLIDEPSMIAPLVVIPVMSVFIIVGTLIAIRERIVYNPTKR